MDRLIKEKLTLIYEYNKKSPLFIHAADNEISKNNLQIAQNILEDGLKIYPDYPTAFILLGKILMLKGEFRQAEEAFTKGTGLINSNPTLKYYLDDMKKIQSDNIHFTPSRRASFASDELNTLLGKNTISSEHNIPGEIKSPQSKIAEFEDQLDYIANKISKAKIIIDDNRPIPEKLNGTLNGDTEIVSETMAMIYLSQKKINEAIDIYEKLKIKFPSRKSDYQNRIDEIKSKIAL